MKERFLPIFYVVLLAVLMQVAKPQENTKFTVLAVQYIGAIDKPIAPIVISNSQAGAEWFCKTVLKGKNFEFTSLHAVSSSQMESLMSVAEEYRGYSKQEAAKSSGVSQTVSVTMLSPQGEQRFVLSVPLAMRMVDGFKERCGEERSLCEDLSHFQKRIFPWAR